MKYLTIFFIVMLIGIFIYDEIKERNSNYIEIDFTDDGKDWY